MNRRLHIVLALLGGVVLSCRDDRNAMAPGGDEPQFVISDAVHNGDPDFAWLPPTVAAHPPAGPVFDATALPQLSIEVCVLDAAGACGTVIQRFSAQQPKVLDRIRVYPQQKLYAAEWLAVLDRLKTEEIYRVRVLRSGVQLGFIDAKVVQTLRELRNVDRSQYVGILKGVLLPLWFRINQASALASVRVNEVESNGGTPGDWIELYNSATAPISLGGYVVRDNDDTHSYILPATASIPARGFLVVEEADLGFGLGAGDAARLYTPGAAALVDSVGWTSHAPTTYGRCPDGSGVLQTTTTSTKGVANDCTVVIRINEVESSGGTPGDWVELYNPGPVARDIAGWVFKDNDNTHAYTIPAATSIAVGGYVVLEEAAIGFGLGAADAARLFAPGGTTLVDSTAWTTHAATTYGRCPNGTGAFATTASSTKGAANDCGGGVTTTVKVNEIESSGGTPGDWTELYNTGQLPVDLSGYVFRDNDSTHSYVLPQGSIIQPGGFFLIEEAAQGFGLGTPDAARLFAPDGTTLVDSYDWIPHAATSYGRCPNGTGSFTTTTASTKGAANACPGEVTADPWPGSPDIAAADPANVLGGNMSGLTYEAAAGAAPAVLWASKNGPGTLYRLVFNDTTWAPDTANGWSAGKVLRYPDGTGDPDAEGVAYASGGSASGLYISTERNNAANSISRLSILRFDPSAAGSTLTATHEWNVTADLPAVGANLGLEAITWVPDAFLVSAGFFDESKGHAYAPAEYPDHGDGLFFVGVEANGFIYAFALNHANQTFTRVATITSGFTGVMGLEFDRELGNFWAICDDTCGGRSAILKINATGRFAVTRLFERPAGMPNLNNEGFAIAPQAECAADRKAVFWSDDTGTGGNAIRRGTVTCTAF